MPANFHQARVVAFMTSFKTWICSLLLIALLIAVGCSYGGPSYSLSPASGTVSMDGKPVANAVVVFHSESAPIASAITDSSGQFQLATGSHGEGIAIGDFLVQISSNAETKDSSGKAISIPIVYSENGVEVVKIAQGGENSFAFNLKSRPKSSDYLSNNPLAEP